MIAPDTNLLLYAYHAENIHHKAAKSWLEQTLSGADSVGFPAPVIYAFIRLLTNPAIAGRIVTLNDALSTVEDWLSLPQVRILLPGDRHWYLLEKVALDGHASANLIPDAVIAAIAMEHGATIHTHDRDFARFPNVSCHYPLTAS